MDGNNINISNSILSSVKKLIGISEEDKSFDVDVMLNINAASSTLFQLGVIKKPYTITSEEDTYEDLIPRGTEDVVNLIKMYFVYKTRLSFDPPSSATVTEALKEMIKETEWRLMVSFNPENMFEE